MPAFHQMGNDSHNLIGEVDGYAGAIVSPVNYTSADVSAQVRKYQSPTFSFVFDPQLYFPNSQRATLRKWSYFPSDVDTADTSSNKWWSDVCHKLVECVLPLDVRTICTPAVVPKSYADDYYALGTWVAEEMVDVVAKRDMTVLQTVVVGMADLSAKNRAMTIASIVSGTRASGIYLVIVATLEPRREYSDTDEIKGVMQFIRALEDSGVRVTVGFCSSDVVLWKHAGATSCATGKFFNLRRFTSGRFTETESGGSQVPYWFEESLFAFLREPDLSRVQAEGFLLGIRENPFAEKILELLKKSPGSPWVGLGWRQYMHWFADIEARVARGTTRVGIALHEAEDRWIHLEDNEILMEERRNDGKWLRAWRKAVSEYNK